MLAWELGLNFTQANWEKAGYFKLKETASTAIFSGIEIFRVVKTRKVEVHLKVGHVSQLHKVLNSVLQVIFCKLRSPHLKLKQKLFVYETS